MGKNTNNQFWLLIPIDKYSNAWGRIKLFKYTANHLILLDVGLRHPIIP
jgi:hypothetical protein